MAAPVRACQRIGDISRDVERRRRSGQRHRWIFVGSRSEDISCDTGKKELSLHLCRVCLETFLSVRRDAGTCSPNAEKPFREALLGHVTLTATIRTQFKDWFELVEALTSMQ